MPYDSFCQRKQVIVRLLLAEVVRYRDVVAVLPWGMTSWDVSGQ